MPSILRCISVRRSSRAEGRAPVSMQSMVVAAAVGAVTLLRGLMLSPLSGGLGIRDRRNEGQVVRGGYSTHEPTPLPLRQSRWLLTSSASETRALTQKRIDESNSPRGS